MTLSNEQLENILYLHQQGISYRAISKQYSISTTSITGALRRYRETGTILPPPTKRFSRFDPYQEKFCERIRYLLAVGKSSPSTRKRQRTTVDLIHQVLCEDGYSISLSKTKRLVRYEKNRLKEGYTCSPRGSFCSWRRRSVSGRSAAPLPSPPGTHKRPSHHPRTTQLSLARSRFR